MENSDLTFGTYGGDQWEYKTVSTLIHSTLMACKGLAVLFIYIARMYVTQCSS